MDLSKSETLTLCQRFFSAIGLLPGVDNEVAELIVWLALRGYPSLENLTQSITQNSRFQSIVEQLEKDSSVGPINAQDIYYDSWVAIADWLVASCGTSRMGKSYVQLTNVRNSYFVLPTLLQRSSQGYEFHAEAAFCQAVFNNGHLWINSVANELPFLDDQDSMKIHCAQINEINPKLPSRHFNVSSEMQFASDQLIRKEHSRIDVEDEIYWKLKEVAAKCFVPASEKSRQRGAGAEVDDSD